MTEMHGERVTKLRLEMKRQGLDGFIVPRADEHLSEYVPASAERLVWLTGFSGSAGTAVVLLDKAALFTDGRYVLQLATQTDARLWQRRHLTENPPHDWLTANAAAGSRIGYDPMLISEEGLTRYTDAGLDMVAVARNPIDAVWTDRPQAPVMPISPHPLDIRAQRRRKAQADRQIATRGEAGRGGGHRSSFNRLVAEHSR